MTKELPDIGHTVSTLDIVERAMGLSINDEQYHVVFDTREKLDELMENLEDARKMEASNNIQGLSYKEFVTKHNFLQTPEELETIISEMKKMDADGVLIYNELLLEIENLKADKTSELVMLECKLKPESAKFTKRSAYTWLKDTFSIEVEEWAPPEPPPREVDKPMRADDKRNHQLTIAGLCGVFLTNSSGKQYGTPEDPNVAQIAKTLSAFLKKEGVSDQVIKTKTIEGKLSASLKAKKDNATEK